MTNPDDAIGDPRTIRVPSGVDTRLSADCLTLEFGQLEECCFERHLVLDIDRANPFSVARTDEAAAVTQDRFVSGPETERWLRLRARYS